MYQEKRPWGKFTVLADNDQFKVKTITVNPGERLSLQSHKKRSEHWIVVVGSLLVTLNNDIREYRENEHIYIPKTVKHRMENRGNKTAVVVEIQTGDYFGEDDIMRYED